MKAYTDYPIVELGDIAGALASIREVEVLSYDGDKHCKILIGDDVFEIKSGYIYKESGRLGEVDQIDPENL